MREWLQIIGLVACFILLLPVFLVVSVACALFNLARAFGRRERKEKYFKF